ncbi:MAG: ribosome small subunit-dependent GTPase A, partial [Gammaproteobacteria bacterium]
VIDHAPRRRRDRFAFCLPLSLVQVILSSMARKLTHQQQRRVKSLQEKRHLQVTTGDESLIGQPQTGLLIMRHGRSAVVESTAGEIISCHLRQNLQDVVAGDRVVWQTDAAGAGVIIANTPRETVFTKTISGEGKALAANISCLVIVFAPEPAPTPGLLDKYLLAAELMRLKPILVLNKCDLVPKFPSIIEQVDLYQCLGYSLIQISTLQGTGLSALKMQLQHETSVVVGQSGVGKSSLINTLLPASADMLRVGDISEFSRFGKHTTSNAQLYHLPSGGYIIDSPGVRDIELGKLTSAQIESGFIECRELLGQCKFRDCSHQHEPGCAVRAAVECGKMSEKRYNSMLEFMK